MIGQCITDLVYITQHLTGGSHEIESLVEASSIDQSEELRSAKRMIAKLRSKLSEIQSNQTNNH